MGSEDEVETGDRKDAVEADNLSVFEKYSKSKRKSKKKKKMVLKAAEREATKWGKDVFSEEDYPIKRSFLYNLYDAFKWDQTQFQAADVLPSLVQVVAVETMAHCKNNTNWKLLGICDGQNVFGKTQKFESKMPLISVLTKSNVSNLSVIRIEAAYIGNCSNKTDIIQELTDDLVNEVKVLSSDIYAREFRESVIHNLVMVLEKVSVVADGSKIGHLLWEEQLLWGSPDKSEAVNLRWFKKATELMEDPNPSKYPPSIFVTHIVAGLINFQFPCGKQISAHRKMLTGSSEVWAAHFSTEATFADQENVKVEDVSADVFHKLLQWVYGTCPQLSSLQVVFDLLYLAEKYLIEDLQHLLIQKISEHLDNIPSDTFLVSELNKTDNEKVFERVFKTLDAFILPLILDRQQLNLDFATVSLVLSRPSLFCDELRLARWLFAWVSHNQPEEEQIVSLASLVKWEMLDEPDLASCLTLSGNFRSEAGFVSSARLYKEAGGFLPEFRSKVQNRCNAAPEGLQMPPLLRGRLRGQGSESCERKEYDKPCIIPISFPVTALKTSLPLALCPDGDTLVKPVIDWDDHGLPDARLTYQGTCLNVELLRTGSLSGKNDVIKDSAGFVVDHMLLRLVLVYVRDGKWVETTREGNGKFLIPERQTFPEDLLSGEKVLQGFLKIFQVKKSEILEEMDDFIDYCDASRERDQKDCEDVSEDEPISSEEAKNCTVSSNVVEITSECLDHEENFVKNNQVQGECGKDFREGTPEPAKTPEREFDDEAGDFVVSQENFSDEEETTDKPVEKDCLKRSLLTRVKKKTGRKRRHALIASIENDEAGEGVFDQGSCAFPDEEDGANDTEQKATRSNLNVQQFQVLDSNFWMLALGEVIVLPEP